MARLYQPQATARCPEDTAWGLHQDKPVCRSLQLRSHSQSGAQPCSHVPSARRAWHPRCQQPVPCPVPMQGLASLLSWERKRHPPPQNLSRGSHCPSSFPQQARINGILDAQAQRASLRAGLREEGERPAAAPSTQSPFHKGWAQMCIAAERDLTALPAQAGGPGMREQGAGGLLEECVHMCAWERGRRTPEFTSWVCHRLQ